VIRTLGRLQRAANRASNAAKAKERQKRLVERRRELDGEH
jgi:hypothetical protein